MSHARRRRRGSATSTAIRLLAALALLPAWACGKKGPPLPPLIRIPVAPGDLAASRRGSTTEIRFVVPAANTDGSKPADIIRVDVFAINSADPVTDDEVLRRGERIGTLAVNPPPDPDEDPDAPKPQNAKKPGAVDQGATSEVTESVPDVSGGIRYYVGVGINKRGRRGPVSRRGAVPLGPAPDAPPAPEVTYNEKSITVSWPAAASDAGAPPTIDVYDATTGKRLNDKAVPDASFTDSRIEWGAERCYAIGVVGEIANLPVESEASPKTCVTLKDTFPPAAPTGVTAVAAEGSVNLIWNPNSEPDLAGYLVLRGSGGEKPKPITPMPIQETTFHDVVPAGTRVTYAIEAVDKAGNVSAMSETTEETAR